MRSARVFSIVLVAAVLWIAAVAPLLPSAGGGLMPCCEGGRPCDPALQATGCCRIDASSDRAVGLAPGVTRNPGSFKAFLPPAPVLSAIGARAAIAVWTAAADDSPPHDIGVPRFLLNAALLR